MPSKPTFRSLRPCVIVLALCAVPTILAQWQVDHRVPGGISGMGTIRQVQPAARLLPSESRYEARAAGYLPSENRLRYLDSGPGISSAHLVSPVRQPSTAPRGVYTPLTSIRYGSMMPGTPPPPRPQSFAPPLPSTAAGTLQPFGGTPTSIRYGGSPKPSGPQPIDFGTTRPIAAPSPYGSPGSIRYSGRFP